MRIRFFFISIVLAAFTAFSLWVIAQQGYTGFLRLAWEEPWGMQIFLDLVIALTLVMGWIFRDARERGINALPFLIATIFAGSIGVLAYLARREFGERASATARPALS
jgi:hypothetical protein